MSKKKERQKYILHEADLHNRVLLTDLSDALGVSKDTIRRDIQELSDQKKLKKVHGGAISLGFDSNKYRSGDPVYASESKNIIARKALDFIEEDTVNLISGGTSNLELIRQLPPNLKATFFTPSLSAAVELAAHPEIEVIFIGGRLSKQAQIAVGGSALNTLGSIKVDYCFLGTGWLDPVNGLTEVDWEVVQLKKAMIKSSRKIISLTIAEKLNTQQRFKVCDIQNIDTLITELDKNSEILKPYINQNINVI